MQEEIDVPITSGNVEAQEKPEQFNEFHNVKDKTNHNNVVVAVDQYGNYTFSNQIELRRATDMMIKTSMAPDHLIREGFEAVAAAMVLCKQFGLPQKAMNQMAFIKGKLTCYGSLVTAIAQKHRKYGEKREFYVDDKIEEICVANKNLKAKVFAAVVQIKKRGEQHWTEYYFTIDDAIDANLINEKTKPDSGWRRYFKDLLMHKARKRALSAEYASALEGIEYHEDVVEAFVQQPRDVTKTKEDSKTEAQKLEKELLG